MPMKFKSSPCMDCKDKKVTKDYNCHSSCAKYDEYRTQFDIASAQRLANLKVGMVNDDAYKRMKSHRPKKKGGNK